MTATNDDLIQIISALLADTTFKDAANAALRRAAAAILPPGRQLEVDQTKRIQIVLIESLSPMPGSCFGDDDQEVVVAPVNILCKKPQCPPRNSMCC